ncbi:30S ribosomal protein S18 [Mycoplasmopsis californica]|uniref:Small ribosomal subunit protein bS18 n=1 Tax=Mycoplasmopsis equigenitalium TaxID=114883 RepID=A0ABY5J0U6_9BACT|nr:30S ribosomal protein S18 [Mycoplasmopsis equigenitalium]UUD36844.1 30S ribosomal protein S18 [Mycoplasmopsis equigenitalium]VEU69860.1 30S ribosomal protein S18 [Mycoplasmopsis californica]
MAFQKRTSAKNAPRNRFSPLKVSQTYIDYKDVDLLKKLVNSHGKILPAKLTGVPTKKQRLVATAIKRARFMALLPFTEERIKR